jgi:hypothetical protein
MTSDGITFIRNFVRIGKLVHVETHRQTDNMDISDRLCGLVVRVLFLALPEKNK